MTNGVGARIFRILTNVFNYIVNMDFQWIDSLPVHLSQYK